MEASHVDLAALAVVQVPTERGEVGLARAAELLLRSGAFGLCVVDLSAPLTWLEGQVAKDMSEKPARVPRLRGTVLLGVNSQPLERRALREAQDVREEIVRPPGGHVERYPVERRKRALSGIDLAHSLRVDGGSAHLAGTVAVGRTSPATKKSLPSLIDLNKSPSGTRHSRCCHGL